MQLGKISKKKKTDEWKYRDLRWKRQGGMGEEERTFGVFWKKFSCICALGTAPPVSASETSAEGTECTDEEKAA